MAQRPEHPSESTIYEESKRRASSGSVAAETSDSVDVKQRVYYVTSPYLNSVRFLDEQYRMRRVGNTLMIDDVPITVDRKGDLSVGGNCFEGTWGLWELLTRKNVNSDVITKSDLNAFKRIRVRKKLSFNGIRTR